MNAPERSSLREAPPLIIALAGMQGSGRKSIAKDLKRKHGFAVAAFQQPIADAIQSLYGVMPTDLCFEPEAKIERVGKSPRQLIDAMRIHAESIGGEEVLTRRLVERTVARGEWGQQDLVITDLSTLSELRWLRLVGGNVWWIRRHPPETALFEPVSTITRLALEQWGAGDMAIVNDGSIDALAFKVGELVERARQRELISSP